MHDTLSRLCGINAWPGVHRCRRESNVIYFFTLVEKQIVPSTRTFIYRLYYMDKIVGDRFEHFYEFRKQAGRGGPPREIFPSFFKGGRSVSLSR